VTWIELFVLYEGLPLGTYPHNSFVFVNINLNVPSSTDLHKELFKVTYLRL
jgi:hypothetical protein